MRTTRLSNRENGILVGQHGSWAKLHGGHLNNIADTAILVDVEQLGHRNTISNNFQRCNHRKELYQIAFSGTFTQPQV